jgi:anti-sigma regulatory factor (Ser/Thr protein kinase)
MASLPDKPDLPNQVLGERFHLQLPSLPHWIEAAAEFLRQRAVLCGACGETRSGKLLVALHEALANAVVHGNLGVSSELKEQGDDSFARALAERATTPLYRDRLVEIIFDYDGQRCRWTITDEGAGFDVDRVLARCLSDDPEVLLASGRGILMMRSFLDEVRFEEGGRRLILGFERESGVERRRKPRLPSQQPLQIVPIRPDGAIDWEAAYRAVRHNLSGAGVGIFQEKLAQTDRILIGMSVGGALVYLPAQVRHCKSVAGNLVELGCSFLSEEEATKLPAGTVVPEELRKVHGAIEGLLEKSPGSPADERRAHLRLVYNERVEVLPRGGPPVVGYGRDLSRSGLAAVTTAPLPLDLAVILLTQESGPPLRVSSRIVRCNKIQDNFYDVGVQFLGLDEG